MTKNSINSLEDLQAEKARVQAQIDIVQKELRTSADRTRTELGTFIDNNFSISKQLGKLFQSDDGNQSVGASTIGAISRIAGLSPWWSGILATLAPKLVQFAQTQMRKRRERKKAAAASETPAETADESAPVAKKRRFFKRKSEDEAAD